MVANNITRGVSSLHQTRGSEHLQKDEGATGPHRVVRIRSLFRYRRRWGICRKDLPLTLTLTSPAYRVHQLGRSGVRVSALTSGDIWMSFHRNVPWEFATDGTSLTLICANVRHTWTLDTDSQTNLGCAGEVCQKKEQV